VVQTKKRQNRYTATDKWWQGWIEVWKGGRSGQGERAGMKGVIARGGDRLGKIEVCKHMHTYIYQW
jgi:hypothetical protein